MPKSVVLENHSDVVFMKNTSFFYRFFANIKAFFSINVGIEEEKVTFHIHILKKVIIKFINEYIHALYGVCYLSYIYR